MVKYSLMSEKIELKTITLNRAGRDEFEAYAYAARRVLEDVGDPEAIYRPYEDSRVTPSDAMVWVMARKLQQLFPGEIKFIKDNDAAHVVLLCGMPRGRLTGMMFNTALFSFVYLELICEEERKAEGIDLGRVHQFVPDKKLEEHKEGPRFVETHLNGRRVAFNVFTSTKENPKYHSDGAKRQLFYVVQPGDNKKFCFNMKGETRDDLYGIEFVPPPNSSLLFRDFVDGDSSRVLEHASGAVSYVVYKPVFSITAPSGYNYEEEKISSPVFRITERERSIFDDDNRRITPELRRAYAMTILRPSCIRPADERAAHFWQEKVDAKYKELEAAGKFDHLKPAAEASVTEAREVNPDGKGGQTK